MARVDYDRMASVYDRGRSLTPEALASWMIAARRHLGDDVDRVLDLGAGTGRFSAPLAETFDADVVAAEPSRGMREQATARRHPRVHRIGAAAEALPLADETCDAAWLSNVIHHFDDLGAAAAELRRILPVGATALVRGAFAGRSYDLSLYRFFPEAEMVIAAFPDLTDTIAAFERAGFTSVHLELVEQLTAHRLSELVERVRLRADTTLEAITDEQFEAGMARLEEAAIDDDGPVVDSLDLLVLR